jgi:hypothetical protein
MPASPKRSSPPSIGVLLDRARGELDALIGEVEFGIRSPVHYEQLEGRASEIGRSLRGAFRSGRV